MWSQIQSSPVRHLHLGPPPFLPTPPRGHQPRAQIMETKVPWDIRRRRDRDRECRWCRLAESRLGQLAPPELEWEARLDLEPDMEQVSSPQAILPEGSLFPVILRHLLQTTLARHRSHLWLRRLQLPGNPGASP